MKQNFTRLFLCLFIGMSATSQLNAQNSVLVNFGSSDCYTASSPVFSLVNNPLSATPTLLANCPMNVQLPDFYNVFIAYNPRDNKIYVADIRSGTETKIWLLDIGLPSNIACPAIPVAPTYSYSYISNNFEFDNNGDLWSFSNYDVSTGQCNMDKFDVNTGNVINTRILQFPAGNFPTTINSGDLTILPNGRMFATLGNSPSRLYEIHNYSSTSTNASATYLQSLPRPCYGIAYLNGQLELTGIGTPGSCYYFDYNISANQLGPEKPFQLGQGPIDNSSFTPSIGVTKQLVNAVKVNDNTADLTYEIFVKNIGNTILTSINVTEDLGAVFGAGNVSNVTTAFVAGANPGALTLNRFFNGVSSTRLLNVSQNLPNQTMNADGYYFKVQVQCRVTNLNTSTIYLNSAIARATIGDNNNSSLINIADSSNNGSQAVVDPNNNGNAGETGENIPTPFSFGSLPVHFISVAASLINKNTASVKWVVATPTINAEKFEVQYSADGNNWTSLTQLKITSPTQASYQFTHQGIPSGNLYYRIRQQDNDGAYTFSRVVLLRNRLNSASYVVLPNPANGFLQVAAPYLSNEKTELQLFDAGGRLLVSKQMSSSTEEINTEHLPAGTYLLKLIHNGNVETKKILIVH